MEIKRDFYLNKLISKMHNKLIKVVTGIRTFYFLCSKITFLKTELTKAILLKLHLIHLKTKNIGVPRFCTHMSRT